jgi:hypothetical protein
MSRNKKEEKYHLERFAESFSEFPNGIRDYAETSADKPDLMVHAPEGIIGIEHTRLFRIPDSPAEPIMQEQEALQNRIVTGAHEAYQAAGGRAAYLLVYFDERVPLRQAEVVMYSGKLTEAMRFLEIELGSESNSKFLIENWKYNQRFPNGLPPGIHSIHFNYVTKPGFELWGAARTAFIPSLTQERIQAKIGDKEKRLDDYRTRCNQLGRCYQVWLLIVCDLSAPSSHFDLPNDVRAVSYKSNFDRVFLMKLFSNSILPLSLIAPITAVAE